MRWDVYEASPKRLVLAQALVDICSSAGWNRASLRLAAQAALADQEAWRAHFPAGPREALWFISAVSDASMRAAFEAAPARNMGEVILERLSQNTSLKAFVRRVMAFDLLHPVQALARMQRTSLVMLDCLAPEFRRAGFWRTTLLNLAYTAIVLVWLLDPQGEGPRTRAATGGLMKLLGL